MAERPQKPVELGFHPAVCVRAFDDRLHHRLGMQLQGRIGDDFHQRAEPEHVAPDRARFLRGGGRLLTIAEHAEPHGVVK